MVSTLLVADAALASVTAILYAYVGGITLRRTTSDAASRRAVRLFAVWWLGLAAMTLVGVLRTAIFVGGITDLTTHVILSYVTLPLLVAILWGLVSYLAYIYMGSPRVFGAITWFHVALLVSLVYLVVALRPTGVELTATSAAIQYANEVPRRVTIALILAIILPALAAAVGYASLYFRTDDRNARYRIAMVSGAFVLWFGSAGIAGLLRLGELEYWPIASRGIALVATIMVLAAYKPPRFAQEAYGVEPVELRREGDTDRRMRLARAVLSA